jgi:hypothetical protein
LNGTGHSNLSATSLRKLSHQPAVALQARAKEYAWWLKFHRCIVRAEIARKGYVSADDEVWLARYDIGENMLTTLTGMPLRKRREPRHYNTNDEEPELQSSALSALHYVMATSHQHKLPVASKDDLRRMYASLVQYLSDPVEDRFLRLPNRDE